MKPNINGRILVADAQFDGDRGDSNVSLIYKPEVKPTYVNAASNDSKRSNSLLLAIELANRWNHFVFITRK